MRKVREDRCLKQTSECIRIYKVVVVMRYQNWASTTSLEELKHGLIAQQRTQQSAANRFHLLMSQWTSTCAVIARIGRYPRKGTLPLASRVSPSSSQRSCTTQPGWTNWIVPIYLFMWCNNDRHTSNSKSSMASTAELEDAQTVTVSCTGTLPSRNEYRIGANGFIGVDVSTPNANGD